MPFRTRSYWLAVGAAAYVCLGALPTAARPLLPLVGLAVIAVWLGEVWRRTAQSEAFERRVDTTANTALRYCHLGAALWVAARLGPAGRPAYDAVANLGVGIAAVSTLVALARLPTEGGLLAPYPSTRSVDAAAFAGLLWGIAVALAGARALFAPANVLLDPLAIDYATTTASIGTLLVFVSASIRLRVQRRLEMGIADRIAGALSLSLTACIVAVATAALGVAAPDRVLPTGVLAAALSCSWTATVREPTTVSAAQRGVLAIFIVGVPMALFVAVAARAFPAHAAELTLVGSALAITVGVVARDVARPLGPEQSRWLDAIEQAMRGALQPAPEDAIRAALEALRRASRQPEAKPELWRCAPPEVLSVDVAGYLHVERAEAPPSLYTLALGEPERTLRAEVLRALEVRRPDVRPLLAWFEGRRAFSATVVVDEEGPAGFLLLPRGERTKPMTLEEARAARRLADCISALLSVSSALARSRDRELDATRRAETEGSERERLERIVASTGTRHRAYAELLARPAMVATYGPAARFARSEIERLAKTGLAIHLVAPAGVDAAAWAALAHLSSPRSGGPLVLVDAATSKAHDEVTWESEASSPLALADGGTLVLLDAPGLPQSIQERIARAFARPPATDTPSEGIPAAGLVLSMREAPETLISSGRLAKKLAAVEAAPVTLPTLAERAEDLRALALVELSRSGVQRSGEPLGIEPAALALLLEHPWPGNDTELRDVITRAAAVARGPVVVAEDLKSIGFHGAPAPSAPPPPLEPPPETRRRRSRPARSIRGR